MSDAALQQLSDAQGALIAALDAQDIEAIDSANAALAQAVQSVRAVGGWHERAGLREEIALILRTADAARGRVNMMADRNRRNLDKLISLVGAPRASSYGRSGRLS